MSYSTELSPTLSEAKIIYQPRLRISLSRQLYESRQALNFEVPPSVEAFLTV